MVEEKQQKTKDAWCKRCKNITKFIQHVDYENRWICTSRGCNHRCREKEMKGVPRRRNYY